MSNLVKPRRRVIINPVMGDLEFVSDNNFSYENIPFGKKLTVHQNNQMIVHDELIAEGDLDLDGSLILEE